MADLGFEASKETKMASPPKPSAPLNIDLATQERLYLQVQRKGRGGKTVTLLGGVKASPAALKQLARALSRALGTGARIEGTEIVIQGDARDRAFDWLSRQGARQISQ